MYTIRFMSLVIFSCKDLWGKLNKVTRGKVVRRISRNRITTTNYELAEQILIIVPMYGKAKLIAVPIFKEHEVL